MPATESSRHLRVTRVTTTADFSAIIRHAERLHLSQRHADRNLPCLDRSTPRVRTTASSFRECFLVLGKRRSASPVVRYGANSALRVPAPRVAPRFHALKVLVIFARILLLLWIGAQLGARVLDGACRALWATGFRTGRRWLAERRVLAAGRPADLESADDSYAEVEEQGGAPAV